MHDIYWFIVFTLANGLLLLALALNVSRLRMKHQIGAGDGGNDDLRRAINAHANGTEQAPIYGLIILSLELLAASGVLVASLVTVFTISRLSHAYGILYKQSGVVRFGAGLTYITQALAIAFLLVKLFA